LKELEFPFTENVFSHELLQREGMVCLINRSKPRHWHYEVVKLKVNPAGERFGKWYPEREVYPSNKEWGSYGFTYQSGQLKTATQRYQLKKEEG
jgi:hypothetical protein